MADMIPSETVAELYLFGEQANEELQRLAAMNEILLNRCAELELKVNRLDAALTRCLDIAGNIVRDYEKNL